MQIAHICGMINQTTPPSEVSHLINFPVNQGGRCGNSMLHMASFKGNARLIEYLLTLDPTCVNDGNEFGMTPLYCCVLGLQDSKSDTYSKYINGPTYWLWEAPTVKECEILPLINSDHVAKTLALLEVSAQEKAYMRAINTLLEHGADPNIHTVYWSEDTYSGKTPSKATPLWEVTFKNKDAHLIELLKSHGGQIHPKLLKKSQDIGFIEAVQGLNHSFYSCYYKK